MILDSKEKVDFMALATQLFDGENVTESRSEDIPNVPAYPEVLLQQSEKGNRYYGSFQRYLRQFIPESPQKLVRWSLRSRIKDTLKKVIEAWAVSEQKSEIESNGGTGGGSKQVTKTATPANALFSWSSADSYVQERRKQLKEKTTTKIETVEASSPNHHPTKEPTPPSDSDIFIYQPTESMTNKLGRVIETESSKFIHARIQMIKAHHNEQISQKIHERKRRDHEQHLHRLKMKEEEYNQSLESTQTTKQGFFGTIFGFSGNNNNNNTTTKKEEKKNELKVGDGENEDISIQDETLDSIVGSNSMDIDTTTKHKQVPSFTGTVPNGEPPNEATDIPIHEANSETEESKKVEDAEKVYMVEEVKDEPKKSIVHPRPAHIQIGHDSPIHSPTILTPVKRTTFTPPVQPEPAGPGKDDDEFDDFLEFTSAAPVLKPKEKPNRFMPLDKIEHLNQDLVDLFDKPSKTNPTEPEDLLSL